MILCDRLYRNIRFCLNGNSSIRSFDFLLLKYFVFLQQSWPNDKKCFRVFFPMNNTKQIDFVVFFPQTSQCLTPISMFEEHTLLKLKPFINSILRFSLCWLK